MTIRILLATDGRTRSDRAVEYAGALGRYLDAAVDICYVVDDRLLEAVEAPAAADSLTSELRTLGTTVVEEAAQMLDDLEVTTVVRQGIPHRVLLEEAESATLIVTGRSVDPADPTDQLANTDRILASADVPVLSVPVEGPMPPEGGFPSALVATDGSEYPERAMASVTDWLDGDATVHGLYVVDSAIYDLADAPRSIIGILRRGGEGALDDLATFLEEPPIRFRRHIRRGRVTQTLLEAIDELEPAVVCVGRRGRTGGNDPIVGSTTRMLLRQAPVAIIASP